MAYDGDKAGGLEATAKALEVLQEQELEVVQYPRSDRSRRVPQKDVSSEALADPLGRIHGSVRVEFLDALLEAPDNIENLQAQIEFVEKMAPMIAQTPFCNGAEHLYL